MLWLRGETWVGFIIHVAALGWGLWEAQLLVRLSPICKSKRGMGQAFQVCNWECLGALGMAREVPGAQSWATE